MLLDLRQIKQKVMERKQKSKHKSVLNMKE
jgi:hypothetical protein